MQPERHSERASQPFDRIWMVAHWKWDLDKGTPWYRKAFFKLVYRPFIRFAWNWFKIPTANGLEIDGKKQTVIWFENGGFFSSEDQADLACVGNWHGYKDVPLNRAFPPESAQYSSLVFPRQKDPRQHRKQPTFSLVVKDRKKEEHDQEVLNRYIKRLNQALDQ